MGTHNPHPAQLRPEDGRTRHSSSNNNSSSSSSSSNSNSSSNNNSNNKGLVALTLKAGTAVFLRLEGATDAVVDLTKAGAIRVLGASET